MPSPSTASKHRRVLTVLLDVPVPPATGLHLRQVANLRLVRELGCESFALVFTTADRPVYSGKLSDLCDGVIAAGPRVEYATLGLGRRVSLRAVMAIGAIRRRPSSAYPFSVPYDLAGAAARVGDAVAEVGADAVVLPTNLLHLAPDLVAMGVEVIGDAVDILSQLTWRLLTTYGRRAPWRAPGLTINHFACRRQEELFLGACTEIWVTTPGEAAVLQHLAPHANVIVAGNVIDECAVKLTEIPPDGPIGFLGTYSSTPNLDAAQVLVTKVLPLVRQHQPGARLVLAGANMPTAIASRFNRLPGVEIRGEVADPIEFTRSCAVMAMPIHVRGGLPLKLVEALACGRPVVASPELVEGMALRDGEDVLVASNETAFAANIIAVLEDLDLARMLAGNGRARFETEFSFGVMLRRAKESSVLCSDHA